MLNQRKQWPFWISGVFVCIAGIMNYSVLHHSIGLTTGLVEMAWAMERTLAPGITGWARAYCPNVHWIFIGVVAGVWLVARAEGALHIISPAGYHVARESAAAWGALDKLPAKPVVVLMIDTTPKQETDMTSIHAKLMASAVVFAMLGLSAGVASALDAAKVPGGKKTKLGLYLTPKEAFELKEKNKAGTLFIDVRTAAELEFLGTASNVDAHVPYEFLDTSKWNARKNSYQMSINKQFVADVTERMKKAGLTKNDAVILMCRSGSRSANGTNLLAAAGFTKVYNQVEGFEGDKVKSGDRKGQRAVNGWKNSGMPWTYKMKKDVMYLKK